MADPITPSRGAAWDNTAPAGKTPALASAFDNTAAASGTPPNAAAWSNTAPDGKTPTLSTAYSNTGPALIGVPMRVSVLARAQSNIASLATCPPSIDGQSLQGTLATRSDRLFLLTQQTLTQYNGVWEPRGTGTSVDVTGTYNISGQFVKSGLSASKLYYFTKNTAGTSVTNGTFTLTETGFIASTGTGDLTFIGTAGAAQLNFLVEAVPALTSSLDEPNEYPIDLVVHVRAGTNAPSWWRLTSVVSTIGTSPVIFEQIT